ncbi:hypothetical protein [Lactobacillus hominis]|uniref:hypothetical protein n=1 Tax=Lactobacillus hominis TaxID=1203033 RepID=UPI000303B012|nr:hypothetical protein [Lactobacillus hominis]KRM85514.1 hypothetical protein FC41_GL000824 [Lactobacillus hominis DSM 23910 = CRBIP 24.179]MCT3347422.1 hypothetical protein [Lactobacillus hominis]
MSKQDLSLKNIIYKNRHSFKLKNHNELKNELKLLKPNSNQIASLINELQFKINSNRRLSLINSILAFILSILSLYISSATFLFSAYYQNLFELSSSKQKSILFKEMMNTDMFKEIEDILLFFTQSNRLFSIIISFSLLYLGISFIHTYRLKNRLSILYAYQRELEFY